MDDFGNRYLLFNQKVASFLGVFPTQTYKERVLRYFILGFMLLSFLVLQLFCQLISWDFSFYSLVFVFRLIIPDVCCVAQYATTVIHLSKVEKAYNMIKLDWQQFKNDDEVKIMQKHAYQTIICTIVCGFLLFLFIGLLILPPVLRRVLSSNGDINNPLFICFERILDLDTFYYPILTYEVIFSIVAVSVGLGCYSMYFMCIQHICSRLSIIEVKFHRPFLNNHHSAQPMDLTRWMTDIIQHLVQIKEYVKLINATGEKNYLFQIMFAFLLLVIDFLCLLQIPDLLKHEGGSKDAFMSIIFVMSNVLPIYISCYVGQRLIDYSENVYKEASLISIHEISLETQKLLLMTLMMNVKPFVITIGKVFVSSHQFFSDILRTSLSFSMMLHSLQKM